jgi:sarcosine oxidase subunit beta
MNACVALRQRDRGYAIDPTTQKAVNGATQQRNRYFLHEKYATPFPAFGRLRFLRQWSGAVDLTPDASPIIAPSPVAGLSLSCGWGSYGFKAIPAGGVAFAHLLATGDSHPLAAAFTLDRFRTGALIDEGGSSGMDTVETLL